MEPLSLSFGRYETLRILVPGFYAAGLAIFLATLSYPSVIPRLNDWPAVFTLVAILLGGILVGLMLYVFDVTKRVTFLSRNHPDHGVLPSEYLGRKVKEWSKEKGWPRALREREEMSLYFFLLDCYFPVSRRDKIEFTMSVFHTVTNIKCLSCLFSVFGFGLLMWVLFGTVSYPDWQWLWTLLFLLFELVVGITLQIGKMERDAINTQRDQYVFIDLHKDVFRSILANESPPPPFLRP